MKCWCEDWEEIYLREKWHNSAALFTLNNICRFCCCGGQFISPNKSLQFVFRSLFESIWWKLDKHLAWTWKQRIRMNTTVTWNVAVHTRDTIELIIHNYCQIIIIHTSMLTKELVCTLGLTHSWYNLFAKCRFECTVNLKYSFLNWIWTLYVGSKSLRKPMIPKSNLNLEIKHYFKTF